jgi:hypothetical protein
MRRVAVTGVGVISPVGNDNNIPSEAGAIGHSRKRPILIHITSILQQGI